jgi:hypothetical protein
MKEILIGDIVRITHSHKMKLDCGETLIIKAGTIGQVVDKRPYPVSPPAYNVRLFIDLPDPARVRGLITANTGCNVDTGDICWYTHYIQDKYAAEGSWMTIRKCSNRCQTCKDRFTCYRNRRQFSRSDYF